MIAAYRPDNLYSRVIGWLKVLLPLAALAILSTLFLYAGRGGEAGDGYSVDDGGIATNTTYSGLSEDGTAIAILADRVRPDTGDRAEGEAVEARLEPPRGGVIDVIADNGELSQGGDAATLTGNVRITTDDGYTLLSDRLDVDLGDGRLTSPGRVAGDGPPGRIDAGAMVVQNEDENHIVTFTGGVRVEYPPESRGDDR